MAALAVVLGGAYVLGSMRPNLPPTPSTPFSMESAPARTPLAPQPTSGRVVMRVNGEPVTESEFNAFLSQAPEQQQAFYASPEGRRLLADQLVKIVALEQEGRRLGVEQSPEASGRIQMEQANVIAAYTLQKLVKPPTEAQMRAEFEKQQKSFDTMQLSHILIGYAGGAVPARIGVTPAEPDAMKKANGLAAKLREGADFAQVARNESDDRESAAQGGVLGEVPPSALPPEVQAVVARLKPGQISAPVKSPYGIHIFKAGARSSRHYEELKPMFAAKLQRDQAEQLIKNIQASAKVELDPGFFGRNTRGRS